MQCPVCFYPETDEYKTYTAYDYSFRRCKNCAVIFAQPMKAGTREWYEQHSFYSPPPEPKDNKPFYEETFLKDAIRRGRNRLLNIGCGYNMFLQKLKLAGYDVAALDVNENVIRFTREKVGIEKAYTCDVMDFIRDRGQERFDLILFFEMLEHLEEPGRFLRSLQTILSDTGIIVFSMPNRRRFIPQNHWADYPPHHLTRWDRESVKKALASCGYRIVKTEISPVSAEQLFYLTELGFGTERLKGVIQRRAVPWITVFLYEFLFKVRVIFYNLSAMLARCFTKTRGTYLYTVAEVSKEPLQSVSVIITTYNRPELLLRAIRSAFAQYYEPLEVIVIDDASLAPILPVLQEKFSTELSTQKLKYFRNDTNSERSFSRNRGIEASNADLCAFLDDDDIWEPQHLGDLVSFFNGSSPDVGLAITNYTDQTEDGATKVIYRGIPSGTGSRYRQLCLTRNIVSGSIYCIRKKVYQEIGGYRTGLEPGEDREFFARIAMKYNVGYCAEPSVTKFTHRGSFAYKTPEAKHARIKENVWLAIQEDARKFSYPLTAQTRYNWYMHLAMNFLPDLAQTRLYLAKAIAAYPVSLLFPETLGLLGRVIAGRKLYALAGNIKLVLEKRGK